MTDDGQPSRGRGEGKGKGESVGPRPSATGEPLAGPILLGLLAFSFLLRVLVAIRPIESLDGVTLLDDTFYTLHLARSMARGLGPWYGLAHTNGFQPLFGLLMVPMFWLFDNPLAPVRAAVILGALADTAALALLARLLMRQVSDGRVVAVVMILWAVSPYSINTATNGLETSLAAFLLLAAVSYFPRITAPRATAPQFFTFGVLGGLALFARIDAGVLLAVAAALCVRPLWARGLGLAARAAVATAAGVAAVNLPWWLYSLRYTGHIYPISGRAVRYISQAAVHHRPTLTNFYLPEIREGVRVLLINHWPTWLLLGLVLALLAGRDGWAGLRDLGRTIGRQNLLLVHAVALFAAYTLYVYTEWFFPRYFYPLQATLLMVTGLALHQLVARAGAEPGRRRRWVLAIAVVMMAVNAGRADFRANFLTDNPRDLASMNIGLWARQHFPDGTVVGSPQSGSLGYFADNLTVVNLDGVVNADAYFAMRDKRLIEYIRAARVQYLLTWSSTIDLIREESSSMRPDDVVLEQDLTQFRTFRKPWHVYRVAAR